MLVAAQVSLAATAGEVVAVEGANGSGKSTLVAAAAGLPLIAVAPELAAARLR